MSRSAIVPVASSAFLWNLILYLCGFHCAYIVYVPPFVVIRFVTDCLFEYAVPLPFDDEFQPFQSYPVRENAFAVRLYARSTTID